jgi:hypothetical protein
MRWKDATAVKFAFEGERDHLRSFLAPRRTPAGGLSLVSLEVQDGREPRTRNLVHAPRACPTTSASISRRSTRPSRCC